MTTPSSIKSNLNLFPAVAYLVIADYDGGIPVYEVATNIDDISEERIDDLIGVYKLEHKAQFKIRRELTEWTQ